MQVMAALNLFTTGMGGCSKFKALIASGVLFLPLQQTDAFLPVGRVLLAERTDEGVKLIATDDLGVPKELKRFFRWNTPYLTYCIDLSFAQHYRSSRRRSHRNPIRWAEALPGSAQKLPPSTNLKKGIQPNKGPTKGTVK